MYKKTDREYFDKQLFKAIKKGLKAPFLQHKINSINFRVLSP